MKDCGAPPAAAPESASSARHRPWRVRGPPSNVAGTLIVDGSLPLPSGRGRSMGLGGCSGSFSAACSAPSRSRKRWYALLVFEGLCRGRRRMGRPAGTTGNGKALRRRADVSRGRRRNGACWLQLDGHPWTARKGVAVPVTPGDEIGCKGTKPGTGFKVRAGPTFHFDYWWSMTSSLALPAAIFRGGTSVSVYPTFLAARERNLALRRSGSRTRLLPLIGVASPCDRCHLWRPGGAGRPLGSYRPPELDPGLGTRRPSRRVWIAFGSTSALGGVDRARIGTLTSPRERDGARMRTARRRSAS